MVNNSHIYLTLVPRKLCSINGIEQHINHNANTRWTVGIFWIRYISLLYIHQIYKNSQQMYTMYTLYTKPYLQLENFSLYNKKYHQFFLYLAPLVFKLILLLCNCTITSIKMIALNHNSYINICKVQQLSTYNHSVMYTRNIFYKMVARRGVVRRSCSLKKLKCL